MALVVARIQVDAIPAGREHEFETQTVRTVRVNVILGRHEVTVQRTLGSLAVVEAVESEGALGQVVLAGLVESSPFRLSRVRILIAGVADSVVAAIAVSSNHAETGREGLDGLVTAGGRVQEVIAAFLVSRRFETVYEC